MASNFCKTKLQGNLLSFTGLADLLLMLRHIQRPSDYSVSFWLSEGQNNTVNNSFNIYMNKKAGLYQDCFLCNDNGCQYEDCQAEHFFVCSFTEQPVAKLRGFCKNTEISLAYYPSVNLGSFSWLSVDGTYIIYNKTSQMWNIAVASSRFKAEASVSYDSLLIGNHLWTVWNSVICHTGRASDVTISLTLCNKDYFNCDDGRCVHLKFKCDGENECQDGSDELNCKLLQIPGNYNKKLTPVCFSEMGLVNVTFEVINVLNIDEKIGKLRLKFRLSAAWNDCRLEFLDLWYLSTMNTLDPEEMNAIWQPVINFDNADLDHLHFNQMPEICVVYNSTTTWTRAAPNQIYNAYVYPASFNSLLLVSVIRQA
jgi:Low-density lipoprotein receptor domain class A/Neurotransmitter-gated ion-channel ligand binding domain